MAPANVEDMFSVREAPWHGLGRIINEAPDSKQALIYAGLDWEVNQRPVYHHVPETELIGADKLAGQFGTPQPVFNIIPDFVANVRSSDNSVLGIVTPRYKPVQNHEAFAFTDALIDSGEVRYETAGSLNNGKKVWMLAKMPEMDVLGDETVPYLVVTNSHDGKGSIIVAITPVRVVCQNTLNLALSSAERMWSTIHTGDMGMKMDEAKRTLNMANQYIQGLAQEADILAQQALSANRAKEIIGLLLPYPVEAGDRAKSNVELLRNELTARYLISPDIQRFHGTAWGFINAVSDFATHRESNRKIAGRQERLFEKTIGGHPLIDDAYTLLKKVA